MPAFWTLVVERTMRQTLKGPRGPRSSSRIVFSACVLIPAYWTRGKDLNWSDLQGSGSVCFCITFQVVVQSVELCVVFSLCEFRVNTDSSTILVITMTTTIVERGPSQDTYPSYLSLSEKKDPRGPRGEKNIRKNVCLIFRVKRVYMTWTPIFVCAEC
jgi:hypothetical protein